jgi:hypothetical protein
MKNNWKKALYFAAEQAYKNEVVDTIMEDLWVGEGKMYDSKEDWVEQKVNEWLEESEQAYIFGFGK